MSELKPCPFCGCLAAIHEEPRWFGGNSGYRIECEGNCGGMTCWWHTLAEAIEKWNARASSPDPASAKSIQRYSMETTKRGLRCVLYCKDDSGDYVKYSDHIQARPDPSREALVGALKDVAQLLGGWREAIAELEDFCSEPVRLKNMTAALDQIDDLAPKIRALAEQGHKGATK